MAIYHFSAQFISRGKGQSATAAAAYRSGEKLFSQRYGKYNEYKRTHQPIAFILTPKNAPEWAKDREVLWNKVEEKEKQKNAQLAREINVALPKELPFDEQEKLVRDYCQNIFVDDGMVADVSIHRDDPNNPHFHVMLTLRSFNENGEFEAKVKKVKDENGKSIRTEINDWNSREKFTSWREQWAHFANEALEKNGFSERITHKSHADLNKPELPTIHEGFTAREMGAASDRVNQNKNIIDFNEKLKEKEKMNLLLAVESEKAEQEVVRLLSPKEKKNLSIIAKELKMFISFSGINEKRKMVHRWEKSLLKNEEHPSYSMKLQTIEDIKEMANEADQILAKEANRYLQKNYPSIDPSVFTNYAKKVLVDESVQVGAVLHVDEAVVTLKEAMEEEVDEIISTLLGDKIYTYHQVDKKIQELTQEAEQVMKEKLENDTNGNDVARNEIIVAKGRNLASRLRGYETAKALIEEHYTARLKALYKDIPDKVLDQLTVPEKELVIGYSDYFGELLDLDQPGLVNGMFSTGEKKHLLDLMTSKDDKDPTELRFLRILHGNANMQQYFFAECLSDPELMKDQVYKERLNTLTERSLSNPENMYVTYGEIRKNGLLADLVTTAQLCLIRELNQLDFEEREKVREMNRLQRKKKRQKNQSRGLHL